jgi:hypothetical protein
MQIDIEKTVAPPLVQSTCTECTALIPTEFESCGTFLLFILKDMKSASPRLLTDAYAMQHPKRACKSPKSYAAHLAGLCCGVEYGGSATVYAAIQRWLGARADDIGLVRPQEPAYRGRLTLRHLYGVGVMSKSEPRLHEWAMDVWGAYASQHDIARGWVETALTRK